MSTYPGTIPTAPTSYVPSGTGYVSGSSYVGPSMNRGYEDEFDFRTERGDIDFMEVPGVIWRDAYETDSKGFYKQVQHIMDHLLMQGPSVYNHGNPNTRKCRDVYFGKVDPKDYDTATNTYGTAGVAEIKDYGFLYTVGQRIVGGKLQMPFMFQVKDVSAIARDKRLNAMVDKFTEMAVRAMASALTQKSQEDGAPADFSFLQNPNINPDAQDDDRPTIEEKAINLLLRDTVLRYNTLDEMRQCTEDKTYGNAQAAHIEVEGNEAYPKRLDPESVSWVARGQIRTAEDCSAISVKDYMSIPDILTQYGHLFGSRSEAKNLVETVRQLRRGGSLNYNPRVYQLEAGGDNLNLADYLTQTVAGDGNTVWETTNWQHEFYPFAEGDPSIIGSSAPLSVLRQRAYFRVIKYKETKVLINGKVPTDKEWDEYNTRNYDQKLDIRLIPLAKGEKAKASDRIHKIPYVELWQATRFGHKWIVGLQRCTHAPTDQRQPRKKYFPILLSVNYKRGIGALSLEFVRLWNVLWNRIDELLLLAGAGSVTWIDSAQMDYNEMQTLRSSARKTGWAIFNSQRLQDRTNPMARQHLQRTQLGDEENKVQSLFALAGLIKSTFDGMIGVGQASQGQAGAYDTTSKLSFLYQQQTAVTQEFWYEDTLFNNQVLQRTAEILRTIKAKTDWADVQYQSGTGARLLRSIKIPKGLADAEPLVMLENGAKMQKIQQDIEMYAQQALASGTAGIREVVKLKFAEDVYEALDIFDSGLTVLDELNARQQQAAQAINQQKVQTDAQKTNIPIEVEKLRGENELAAIAAKQQGQRQAEDFKGQMADTEESWNRERNVQESELAKDQSAFDGTIPDGWGDDETQT